ncbi:Conidiation protein 6-domain-containing protein [Diplogelasinospora grovesii]|uniref:Conidiation protein 6-domain-containing protein n=1 Tax=Diplogelasinospora grovesii TaxID=303347 RepID=A0AAN6S4P9_9PEZI|nr:Conidiation protein 6-domain-containing protein [Diplogelasinospora grovesii]
MTDPGNRERGLKAAISNPRVSEAAKERDREILETEFGHGHGHGHEGKSSGSTAGSHSDPGSGGKRGTAKQTGISTSVGGGSPSEEEEEHTTSRKEHHHKAPGAEHHEKEQGNVIRGLKAAISNPHVSEAAKQRDRERLEEMGESA